MRSRQQGFTLVEMLVAFSVVALLVGLVYGAVRIGQRSVDAANRQAADTEVIYFAWQFLRDAVAQARPGADGDETDSHAFLGARDSLEFTAWLDGYVGGIGLFRIRLAPASTSGGQELVLTRTRLARGPPHEDVGESQHAVLVDAVERVQIRYFGAREPEEPAAWHDDWAKEQALPNLVLIQVEPEDAAAWPILIARPNPGAAPLTSAEQPVAGDVPGAGG